MFPVALLTVMNDQEDSEQKKYEVTWDGLDDPMNPKNMPKTRKWIVTLIVSAGATCV